MRLFESWYYSKVGIILIRFPSLTFDFECFVIVVFIRFNSIVFRVNEMVNILIKSVHMIVELRVLIVVAVWIDYMNV